MLATHSTEALLMKTSLTLHEFSFTVTQRNKDQQTQAVLKTVHCSKYIYGYTLKYM